MVSLQILGFSVACCSLCVGCLWFPYKFWGLKCFVLFVMCWMFVTCKISGFSVQCCSCVWMFLWFPATKILGLWYVLLLCVGCLWFPCKF
jgi:hypothetical protein